MVRVPAPPMPSELDGRPLEDVWRDAVDRWLTMVERNRGLWLAAIRDPELEDIFDAAREASSTNILNISGAPDTPGRRAYVRIYGAGAEAATIEWLQRGRLEREQVVDVLVRTLLVLIEQMEEHTMSNRTFVIGVGMTKFDKPGHEGGRLPRLGQGGRREGARRRRRPLRHGRAGLRRLLLRRLDLRASARSTASA